LTPTVLALVGVLTVFAAGLAGAVLIDAASGRPRTVAAAVALGLLGAAWGAHVVPLGTYSPRGHEIVYLDMARGTVPADSPTDEFHAALVPRGVAELSARTPASWRDDRAGWTPTARVTTLWLLSNRLALVVWVLAVALIAARLGPPGAGPLAAVLAAALPLATAWSTTGYLVVPALACASCALLAGLSGARGTALLLGVVALGARPDTAPLVVAAMLAPGPRPPRARVEIVLGGLGAVLAVAVLLWGDAAGEIGGGAWRQNLAFLVPGPGVLALGAAALGLVAYYARSSGRRSTVAALGAGLVVGGLALLAPPDVGARHLLGGATLGIVLSAAAVPRDRWTRRLGAVLVAVLVAACLRGQADLRHRTSGEGALPEWVAAADSGRTRAIDEVVDLPCALALPVPVPGTGNAGAPGDLIALHDRRREGACVLFAAGPEEMRFSSDTRSERFDRARSVLDLRPLGWVAPTTDGADRWMLWGDPRAADVQ